MQSNQITWRKFERKTKGWLTVGITVFAVLSFVFVPTTLAATAEDCYAKLQVGNAETRKDCNTCCGDDSTCKINCVKKLSQMEKESTEYQAQSKSIEAEAAQNQQVVEKTVADIKKNDTTGYYAIQDAKEIDSSSAGKDCSGHGNTADCEECCSGYGSYENVNVSDCITLCKQLVTSAATSASGDSKPAATATNTAAQASKTTTTANPFLGSGFEDKGLANFSGEATNKLVGERKGGFAESGIGWINSVVYNVKDYFKYVAGSMAVLWMLVAAFQLVTATDDEGIKKGKTNLQWSIIALTAVFAIDVLVIAFFEGGKAATPGESLFTFIINNGKPIYTETSFVKSIATYFQSEAKTIFNYLKVITGAIAILFMFLAGVHMISAGGNEENIEKEKKYLMHSLTAFITLIVLDSLIFNFIYPTDTTSGLTTPECVEFLKTGSISQAPTNCRSAMILGQSGTTQIMGVVNFFSSLMGGIAIFFIVYSAISIISSFGNEENVTKHKKTLMWSLAGLAVILLADTLVRSFFFVVDPSTGAATVNAAQGFKVLTGITNFLTTFVGIFSVVAILIAGIIWVANFGNTEIAEKAKKIILGAAIGIIISVAAYSLVNSLVSGKSGESFNQTSVQVSI